MKQPWWERVRLGYWRLRWRLACAVQGRHYTNEHGYCSRCDRVVAKPKAILGTGDKVMGTVDQVTQTDDGIRITGTLTTSRREPQLRKGSVAGRGDVPKRAPAPSVIPPTSRRDVIALALKDWALGRERGWAREVYDPGTALDHHRGMESST